MNNTRSQAELPKVVVCLGVSLLLLWDIYVIYLSARLKGFHKKGQWVASVRLHMDLVEQLLQYHDD